MHSMFFGIKRVHLRTLHISRALLHKMGLTPARFDMMRIIELHAEFGGVAQAKIIALLGVSGATVSRMLSSLERLGYVVREEIARDRRALLVRITALGLERVRHARETLVDSARAGRLALRAFELSPDWARPQLEMMVRFLSRIRKNFFDPAPFEHPWTNQDLVPYIFHTIVDGRLCYGAPIE
jgi:DNA-binding MarR family transcriptional regulator